MPTKLQQPIPETDLSGVGFRCIQLLIPDTLLWQRWFFSLVSASVRGFSWRGETGDIKAVQQIAWNILKSIRECEELEGETESQTTIIIREEIMTCGCSTCGCGQVTLPTTDEGDLEPESEVMAILPDAQPPLPTDAGAEDWLCKCAQHSWSLVIESIAGMTSLREAGGLTVVQGEQFVADVLSRVYGGVFLRVWVLYTQMVYYVMHFVTATVSSRLIAWVNSNFTALTDAVACAGSVSEAQGAVTSIIWASSALTNQEKLYMIIWASMYPYEGVFQSEGLRLLAPDRLEILALTNNCSCGTEIEFPLGTLPPEYVEVPMLMDIKAGSLNGGDVVTIANRYCWTGQGNSVSTVLTLRPQYLGVDVANEDIVGFQFHQVYESIPNCVDFGHNLENPSTHFPRLSFGATAGNWLTDEKYVGVEATDVGLQAWIAGESFRYKGLAAEMQDHTTKNEFTFTFYGGTTSSGAFNEAVVDATWIIKLPVV